MASRITNYQCPACTGPLHFGAQSGLLECDYCGSKFEVQEIEALYKDKDESAAKQDHAQQAKTAQTPDNTWDAFQGYVCPSCGAELVCDDTTAATSCPYCGNPSIVPGKLDDMQKPDYVLPFRMNRQQAVEALKKYYKGKKLLPSSFSKDNHIEEIKGVYVPFWLYDGETDADVHFHATRVHSHIQGDYEVTVTDHFRVHRAGTVAYSRLPVDASSKMPDAHMDAIEPFDYSELTEFSTAYLPGYYAEKYDEDAEKCSARANERAKNTALNAMQDSVMGFSSCVVETSDVQVHSHNAKYALMPVWMLSTKWQGKNYLFAMNGQTGKLIGDLPISKGKLLAWFAGICVPLWAIFAMVIH